MPPEVASLLLQSGLVGVFIWYSIQTRKAEIASQAAQNLIWQTLLENEQEERKARDLAWQNMVENDRAQREQIANRHEEYFNRIHELSGAVERLAFAMGSHDTNAQERTQRVLAVLSDIKQLVSSP